MQTLCLPYTPHPNPLPLGRGDKTFSGLSIEASEKVWKICFCLVPPPLGRTPRLWRATLGGGKHQQ
jgi:hypothetical protein